MTKKQFTEDTYITSPDTKKYLFARIFPNSRWLFYLKYFSIVLYTRKQARKGIYDFDAWMKSSFDIMHHIERFGGRFEISGFDNLRNNSGPVVLIGNHMSTLETMVLPCLVAPFINIIFVVKQSLANHPFIGEVLRARDVITVTRENSRQDLITILEKGIEKISKGLSVVIFPQTTRRTVFNPAEFNSIGVKLAQKANVKIIPFALKTDFWSNGKGILKDLGEIDTKKTIHFAFGAPIELTDNGKNANVEAIAFIEKNLTEWK